MQSERTLLLLKPDAVQRMLVGTIICRLEQKGLRLLGIKMTVLTRRILEEHYAHLVTKPFFAEICSFMSSSPVIVTCWEGLNCVEVVRAMCGTTNSREALPGTIRGDFGMSVQANLIHASDSVETAKAEVERFFRPEEIFSYNSVLLSALYSSTEAKVAAS